MRITTEIVTMKVIESVVKDDFIRIVDGLERNFHSKQPGFIDSELLYNDKANEWIMIQHWNGLDNLRSASKKIFENPAAGQFVKSIDPKSVKMLMFPRLRIWQSGITH